ncbi:MAG: hypothetical protein WBO08_18620 [Mycobacterium sp.]
MNRKTIAAAGAVVAVGAGFGAGWAAAPGPVSTVETVAVAAPAVQAPRLPDPNALVAAAPPETRHYLSWALDRGRPFIFLADNGAGKTCQTWVVQSDGQAFAFAGDGPYRGGLLANTRLVDVEPSKWSEQLQCTIKEQWVSVAPTPPSEMPR